jgi:hypothetical protein
VCICLHVRACLQSHATVIVGVVPCHDGVRGWKLFGVVAYLDQMVQNSGHARVRVNRGCKRLKIVFGLSPASVDGRLRTQLERLLRGDAQSAQALLIVETCKRDYESRVMATR